MEEVFWIGDIDENNYSNTIASINEIFEESPLEEIVLYVTTGGGQLTIAFAFLDFIRIKKIKLTTFGLGGVHSAGLVLMSAGTKRLASKNTFFLFHSIGAPVDALLSADEIAGPNQRAVRTNKMLIDVLAQTCKADRKLIKKLLSTTNYLSAIEAKKLGLIHKIL